MMVKMKLKEVHISPLSEGSPLTGKKNADFPLQISSAIIRDGAGTGPGNKNGNVLGPESVKLEM